MSEPLVFGMLFPGDMGSTLARLLRHCGHRVIANLNDRSERTRTLAEAAGVERVQGDDALLREADVILSILWPSKAIETAQRIADAARRVADVKTTLYADLNAIAPESVRAVESAFEGSGVEVVDGGILGGPANLEKQTCPVIALSGRQASSLAETLRPAFGQNRVKVVGDTIGSSSALKLA